MDNTDNQEINRLKFFRQYLNLSQKDIADTIKLARTNYSRIESGKAGLSYNILLKLVENYDLNPLWLMKGWGPMLIKDEDKGIDPPSIIYEEGKLINQMSVNDPPQIYDLENRIGNIEESLNEFRELMKKLSKQIGDNK